MIIVLIFSVCVTVAFLPIPRLPHPFFSVFTVIATEVFAALTTTTFEAFGAFLGC